MFGVLTARQELVENDVKEDFPFAFSSSGPLVRRYLCGGRVRKRSAQRVCVSHLLTAGAGVVRAQDTDDIDEPIESEVSRVLLLQLY